MEAVDELRPRARSATLDKPFLMPIEDVFTITGRGTVVTGRVERGAVKVGDEVEIVGLHERPQKTVCHRRRDVPQVCSTRRRPATTPARCCAASKRDDIERGQVLAKPGSITPHTTFEAEIYVLLEGGGRPSHAVLRGYRPQFYFRTTDVTGSIMLPEGTDMACRATTPRSTSS